MDYYSGVSDALRLTFVQVMIMANLSIGIFIIGMYINLKKWGMGSTGYGKEPSGSIFAFPRMLAQQMSEHAHVHNQSVLETFVLDIVFQRRILRRSPLRWFMHFTIFFGWMALFVLSLAMFAVEMVHIAAEAMGIHDLPDFLVPALLRDMLAVPNDIFSYILLTGIIIAIYRRLFVAKVRESTIAYDSILLIGLTVITISGFVADGIRTGRFWGFGIEDPSLAPPMALFHVVISLLFCIAYIPFSKYIHMIAIPLALLANKGGE
ncbi:CoB-CoM heterodisulfide reductase, subunit E [Methanolobus psychrophilus R15]|nr:CoB-CoM heterodisulfide reductase, subunit E [Methanolobus psychrophilus R15]